MALESCCGEYVIERLPFSKLSTFKVQARLNGIIGLYMEKAEFI